jgi:hyaluronoglucosaminidase
MLELRGIIEGFYGRPWSWSERMRMLEFMGAHGFNHYAYAPKNDPLHRNRWREAYLPVELERFGAFQRDAAQHGIEFSFGLTPLEFHFSDPKDYAVLLEKFRAVQNVGVSSFVLLLDDISESFRFADDAERFASLGAAQAWLCNRLWTDLRPARLIFTPTEYHGHGDSAYLRDLGQHLEPEVNVFWTGPQICSRTITTPHLETVASSLRRAPIIWDNYPVNDLDMRFDPHLRPYRGRDSDLERACKGVVINAALQAEASKIALHTVAQWLEQPEQYEPESAWLEALRVVTAPSNAPVVGARLASPLQSDGDTVTDAEAVAFLARLSQASALEDGVVDPDLEARIKTMLLEDLPGFIAELRAVTGALEMLGNEHLRADLEPWTVKLRGWLEVLKLAHAGDEAAALERLRVTRENFHRVGGDLLEVLARRALWARVEAQ